MTKIGTHNGVFHADDVMAVAILKKFHNGDTISVIRTRDKAVLDGCHYVVDVGGVHDPNKGRFDHHQDREAVMASAGLVWSAFGADLCGDQAAADYVYKDLIQGIDEQDLGKASNSFSQVLSGFNPGWHETPDHDDQFLVAVDYALVALTRAIARAQGLMMAASVAQATIDSQMIAASVAQATIDSQTDGIAVLESYAPIKELLVDSPISFLVYPGLDGNYRGEAIPTRGNQFAQKVTFPEGVKTLPGVIFRHNAGFLVATADKDSAIAACKFALGDSLVGVV